MSKPWISYVDPTTVKDEAMLAEFVCRFTEHRLESSLFVLANAVAKRNTPDSEEFSGLHHRIERDLDVLERTLK